MTKWQEVRGIKPTSSDALVSAACRYLNTTDYPNLNTVAAIVGLEQVEVEDDATRNESCDTEDDEFDDCDLV